MIVYYLFYLILVVLSFLQGINLSNPTIKKILHLSKKVLPIFLLIFIGFRYKIGTDWYEYLEFYNSVETIWELIFNSKAASVFNNNSYFEFGFKIICSFFKSLGLNFYFFNFVVTAFNLFSITRFIKKYEIDNSFLFILVFYSFNLFTEFDVIRQSIAFYIVLFSFEYIHKSFLKYSLIILLSMAFHLSSVIFIPLYIFIARPLIKKKYLFCVLFIYFLGYLYEVKVLTELLNIFLLLSNSSVLLKVKAYLILFNYPNKIGIFTIIYSVFLIYIIYNYNKLKNIKVSHQVVLNIFVCYGIISVVFSEVKVVEARLIFYFNFSVAFLMAIIPKLIKLPYTRMVFLSILCLYPFLRFHQALKDNTVRMTYSPYYNYLFLKNSDEIAIMNKYKKVKDKVSEYYEERIDDEVR